MKFKRFYVTDPLCCPSRATFLTGQYAHNTGVISDGGPDAVDALREQDTLGVWLQQAGYRTAFVGKYLNGYGLDDPERVPPGWSEWKAADRADHPEVLRLRPQRGRRGRPLRQRAGGLQDPGSRPSRGRRRPPRVARQPAAVPLRRLQRPARAEHPGAGRRRLARRGRRRRATRPSTSATSPTSRASSATARRSAPKRSPGSTTATSGRSSRSPRSTGRWRGSSRRCATRASSATPTSSSPPTTATSTGSTESSSAGCSPTSRRATCRC